MHKRKVLAILAAWLFCPALLSAGNLSPRDIQDIRDIHKRYEETWLKGDADGVRALFTENCVLFPPHGDTPRIGQKGLNEFWFPPSAPPTRITRLVVIPQDIGGDEQIAYVWGTDEVAWTTTQGGKATASSHKGIFLNVLQKQPDGKWKISHHMWDDAVATK